MEDFNAQLLFEKYPELFRKIENNSPFEHFGFEIKAGWFNILDTALGLITSDVNAIKSALKRTPPEHIEQTNLQLYKAIDDLPIIAQVKEKWGVLVIYADKCSPYHKGVFEMAEMMSTHICEYCGNSGKTYRTGWYKTLCQVHAEKFKLLK